MFETGNQLKGYIQRETKENNISSNYGYNYYFTRKFLEKLYSNNSHKFVLKGSYSQFNSLEKINRPLTDVDIVTFDKMEYADDNIEEIINSNDKVKFKILNKFTTTNATLNYKILCDFDGKTSRISVDLKREYQDEYITKPLPKLFSKDQKFDVNSITLEEHLANKLYIVLLHIKLYYVLSREFRRFKDFYDIHSILGMGIFDERKVIYLLNEKIKNDEFLRDYELQTNLFSNILTPQNEEKWLSDKKTYEYFENLSLKKLVETTSDFIEDKRIK